MQNTNTVAALNAVNAFAVASVAAAALSYSFEWRAGNGGMMTITVEARVSLRDDRIQLHVEENAAISADMCREACNNARIAVRDALELAGIAAKGQTWKHKGGTSRLFKTGDWYMSSFHCDGRYCQFRIV